jgi:hypothetical protein
MTRTTTPAKVPAVIATAGTIRRPFGLASASLGRGERQRARSIGARPGVRDECERDLVDPRRKLDTQLLAIPETERSNPTKPATPASAFTALIRR